MFTKKKIFRILASFLCVAMILPGVACCDNTEESSVETPKEEQPQATVIAGEYLYKDGVSEYSVVVRDDANYYETMAATELVNNLKLATGNSIRVITDDEFQGNGRVISLGHTSLWEKKVNVTLSEADIVESGYYIKTVDNSIYISCPDNTSSSGVLYGVYDFLGDAIDYEFYAKDEIYYEKKKDVPLYNYSGYTVNPSFEMRMLRNADLRDDSMTVMRYRMVYPSSAFGMVTWGHGQISQYINPDAPCTCGLEGCSGKTYYQHHSDWFSKYGSDKLQLCWTGGEVLETVTANRFIEYFQQYPDAEYFMFGQEDNMSYCDCERCVQAMKEYAGQPSGLQIAFMNNVIEKTTAWLNENQPGRQVKYIVYAYYGVETAPVKTLADGTIVPYSDKVDPDDSLYIFYAPIGANFAFQIDSNANQEVYKNLKEWSIIADGQIIMYLYDINFRSYLINFNNFGTAKGMYQTCKDLGVACMTSQAADSYTACFQEMRSYVESALMWDLSLSYDDLVRKFMKAYYKDAADNLYAYYDIIRSRYAYYQNTVKPESGSIYGDINNSILWTPGVMEKINAQFDEALKSIEKYQTSDPELYETLKNRIMKERLSALFIDLTIIPEQYTDTELAQKKADFKYYVNLFKFSEAQEGSGFGSLLD